jgi:membrane-bound lytic murein transglycosylase D
MKRKIFTVGLFIILNITWMYGDGHASKPFPEDGEPVRTIYQDTTSKTDQLNHVLSILSLIFPNDFYVENPSDIKNLPSNNLAIHDTIPVTDSLTEIASDPFENSLDSLVNVYEVKETLGQNGIDSLKDYKNEILTTPDSVLIARLSKIPSIIPLPYNEIVRKFIEMYLVRKRDKVEVMLGLSNYYFPIFEEILDLKNLPHELKYMAVIESALHTRAKSRAGATGIWQFMFQTGRLYGLEINTFVDQRCDPVRASIAASDYLNDSYDLYKDWPLVIASYNCGSGNVNKAIRRSGGLTDYWQIYPYLPRETRGYVPAFIAATYIMYYYKELGLTPQQINLPPLTDTIMINRQLHFNQIAEVLNIPVEQIEDLNPQYRRNIIPGSPEKWYSLVLPVEATLSFIEKQQEIYAYKDSLYFNKNLVVEVATRQGKKGSKREKMSSYASVPKDYIKLTYTVQSGDNIGFVASWYNVSKNDIQEWNGLYRNRLKVGQNLAIYVPKDKAFKYERVNTMSAVEKQALLGSSVAFSPVKIADEKYMSTNNNGNFIYHKVSNGENLWTIAKKYPGVTNFEIMRLNNLTSYEIQHLKPGDILKIKRKI